MAPTSQAGWHGEDIRAAIRKRYRTVRAFAATTPFTLSAICKVLNGTFLPAPTQAIADAIGIAPAALWPQWYHPDGTPRLGRNANNGGKSSAARRPRNAQSARAA